MKKAALITGASGGIGYELSRLFARDGYDLVLVARSERKLLAMKQMLEAIYAVSVWVIPQDLSEKDAAKKVFDKVCACGLHVDVLVNNAGFGDFARFADCCWDKQYEMIQLDIVALIQMTRYFVKPMIAEGYGRILNVASVASFQAGPFMSVYYGAKAFVLSFSESIAMELKGSGVTVTALCPGPTETGFGARAGWGNSGVVKYFKMADAKEVAKYGYQKLREGKTVAVPGAGNKFLLAVSKFAPRAMTRHVMYVIQAERRKKEDGKLS